MRLISIEIIGHEVPTELWEHNCDPPVPQFPICSLAVVIYHQGRCKGNL